MKRKIFVIAFLASALVSVAAAQSVASAQWVGIWHADMDGLPTSTLTLAADTGELGGTVVLDMVSDEGGTPHVIASEPHVLMNPHVDGDTLSFHVKMQKPDGTVVVRDFTVTLTSPGNANFHCMNCGADAPVVHLVENQ
jgi:hypothetical protein